MPGAGRRRARLHARPGMPRPSTGQPDHPVASRRATHGGAPCANEEIKGGRAMTTAKAAASSNGARAAQAGPPSSLAEVLPDAAGKVDAVLRRNAELERENAELRHELASARTRAEDVRREALEAVNRVLSERGVG